jgi:tetratricopeptide (TPR) repeat protein
MSLSQHRDPRWVAAWAIAGLLIALAVVAVRVSRQDPAPGITVVAAVEEFVEPIVSNPGYLGPQACADCHAERVAKFHQTRHFLANCVPDPHRVPKGFLPGQGTFQLAESALRFEMTESEGQLLQSAIRESDPQAKPISANVAFIYGSEAGNDEVYFTRHGDRLNELPMVWLAALNKWGASPFDRHGSGDFSREMTIRCVECHNTWFEHVPGSRNQYDRDGAILGVTCEVCHGPGQEHVAFHREHPRSTDAHGVVRPATLSRERLMDLCAQCHSNALRHRGPAFQYRPGLPLDDFYVTLKTRHPEDDHVANQTTYLRQSRCFQESDSLTCVTCHDPHRQRSTANAGAASCRTCHEVDDCTDRLNLPTAVQENCISCHMPEQSKIQVFFQTEEDRYVAPVKRYEHKIGIYPRARQSVLLDWHRTQTAPESQREAEQLTKQLGEAWKLECDTREKQFRFLAAIDACREATRFDPSTFNQEKLQQLIALQSGIDTDYQDGQWHAREGRHVQAVEHFQRILAVKPDYALAHGRLGTAYAAVGEKQLAIKHLRLAESHDPNEPYAPAMLGWLAYLDEDYDMALEHYARAEAIEPYSAMINARMGVALVKAGRDTDAILRLTRAITIDPRDSNAFLGLSQAHRRAANASESLKYGLRAARLTRLEKPEILLNLAEAYAEVGQWAKAITTAEQALAIVPPRQSSLAAQIRIRLDEFRTRRGQRR